jgi:hypothetical protein
MMPVCIPISPQALIVKMPEWVYDQAFWDKSYQNGYDFIDIVCVYTRNGISFILSYVCFHDQSIEAYECFI